VATLNFVSDITERKRAEEELRRSEEKHRMLFETMAQGVIFQDADDRIISVNPAAERILGLSFDQMQGRTSMDPRWRVIHEDGSDSAAETRPSVIALRTGKKAQEILAIFNPIKESWTWVSISAVPQFRPGESRPYQVYTTFEDITDRKQAEEVIRTSLREKEVLLREIHHRVKNNMQVISSLFNLQAGYIKDEEALRILKEGQTRIRSMALVHEKLYKSGDLSKIDLAGYIRSLLTHLFHAYLVDPSQVRLETELEDVPLDINTAMPCGLILNELISNALKHAFPSGRKGVLMIRLRRGENGAVELRIADNGVGFPKGLDFRRTDSLGMQIVNLLVGQLGGTIKLVVKNGTAFTVAFRETKQESIKNQKAET
jgi:PAS domain S-box-containing protein